MTLYMTNLRCSRRDFPSRASPVTPPPLSRQVSDMLRLAVFPSKSKIKIDKWHLSSTADSGASPPLPPSFDLLSPPSPFLLSFLPLSSSSSSPSLPSSSLNNLPGSFYRSTPEFRPPPIDVVSSPVGILRSPENAGDKLARTRWLEDIIEHELNKSGEEEAAGRDVDGSQSDRQDERNEDGGTSRDDRKPPAGRTAGLLLRESEAPLPSPLNRTLKKEGVHVKRPLEVVEEQEHVAGDASKDSRMRAVEAGDREVRAPRSPVVQAWTSSIRGEEKAGKHGGGRDVKGTGKGSSQEPVLSAGRDEEQEEQEGPSPSAASPVVELRPSPIKSSSTRRNLGWNDKTVQSLEYRPFYWFW